MKVVQFLVMGLGCSALLVACSGSSDDDDGDSGGHGDSGVDWSKIDPPDNVDITTCASITEDTDPELDGCIACCTNAGFSTSGFINDGHCTCGRARNDDGDTVCMNPTAQASLEACGSCCSAAGYSGASWVGGTDTASCTCSGRQDSTICEASLASSVPGEACFYCCLENGFLGAGYAGFGDEECSCIDP